MHDVTKTLLELLMRANISHYVFQEPFTDTYQFDLGLREMLIPLEESPYEAIIQRVRRLKEKSLYQLRDVFLTNYALFKLPDEPKNIWLSVGPVLINKPEGAKILSLLNQLNLPVSAYHELDTYYDRLPLMKNQEVFDRICTCIGDSVFGGRDQYVVKEIHNSTEPNMLQEIIARIDPLQPESVEEKRQRIQHRYDLENEILKNVRLGNTRGALTAYYNFVRAVQGKLLRMPDLLRDLKDFAITVNTLLRKVTEEAGVSPFYIDSFSNSNVIKLEQFNKTEEVLNFFRELITGYCNLIQEYALNHYSKPVQAALLLVQSDLSSDLTLGAVAQKLNLNRNYLSDLFRRETGEVFSSYVLKKRIQQAKYLLSTTSLPIQDIAWEVGFPDANYFTRLFRRETGHPPKYFRGKKIEKYET